MCTEPREACRSTVSLPMARGREVSGHRDANDLDSREYPRNNIYELSRVSVPSDSPLSEWRRIWPLELLAAEC